jgi:hypothetical protein
MVLVKIIYGLKSTVDGIRSSRLYHIGCKLPVNVISIAMFNLCKSFIILSNNIGYINILDNNLVYVKIWADLGGNG